MKQHVGIGLTFSGGLLFAVLAGVGITIAVLLVIAGYLLFTWDKE